jgi:mono/diheme cytochrome c family protein
MCSKSVGFAVGAIALSSATMVNAQQKQGDVDIGKWEFESHCAICHGMTGKGEGIEPYWNLLKTTPANLTTLSKNNGGVFPFARVYQTIDGREQVAAHGTREMPVWGREYMAESASISPYYDHEAFARAKILALTEYVYRLQEK